MSSPRPRLLMTGVLLTGAALLGQATALNASGQTGESRVAEVAGMRQMVSSYSLSFPSAENGGAQAARQAMLARLADLGFQPAWNRSRAADTVEAFYSSEADMTVLCRSGQTGNTWTQVVRVLPRQVSEDVTF